jgi:hypothetical protein
MSFNPNLQRYVIASLSRILEPVLDTQAYEFWVESIDFDESEILKKDNAVLRIVGPDWAPGSGVDVYRFEVVVLFTDLLSHGGNAYSLITAANKVAETLANPIPVQEWGNGELLLGCLDLDHQADEPIRLVSYGVIDKDTRVKQQSVIAKYEIRL